VFDGAGHLAFTATGSGEFGKFATSGLAQGLLKKLAGSQSAKPEPEPLD
jgi:hypothetical protein